MSKPKGVMHPVTVTVTKQQAETRFTAASELWDEATGALRFHKDHHGMKKHDYHLVEFVLDDRSGDGLRFPDSPHSAMWVSRVADPARPECPNKNTESDYEVLEPICVCDGGQRLIARNDNPRREQWAFTLNFVKRDKDDADQDGYVSWDPITDNRNGGAPA